MSSRPKYRVQRRWFASPSTGEWRDYFIVQERIALFFWLDVGPMHADFDDADDYARMRLRIDARGKKPDDRVVQSYYL